MTRFALWRVAMIVPIMLVATLATFLLQSLNPTDPAERMVGPTATDAQVAEARAELDLDEPLLAQYGNWLEGGAPRGSQAVHLRAPSRTDHGVSR